MLLRHVAQHRTTVFFRGLPPGTPRPCSMSSSSESSGPYYDSQNDKTNKKKGERRENRNGSADMEEKKKKLGKDVWDLRHALLRPVPELKNLFQSQIIAQEETNTKLRAEWGPKNEREMYRNPFYPPRLFPWIYHPLHSPTPPEPNTSNELLVNLIAMRNNTFPVISLTKMVRYHEQYAWLQSSETFDTLLELAVRHSSIGCARKLVLGMRANEIAPTERTVLLITRLKIRLGHRIILRLRKGLLPPPQSSSIGGTYPQEMPGDRISRLIQDLNDERLQNVDGVSLRLLTEYLATPQRRRPNEYKNTYLYAYRRDMRRVFALEDNVRRGQMKYSNGRIVLPRLTLASVQEGQTNFLQAYEQVKKEYSHLEARPAGDFVPRTPSFSTVLMARLASMMPEHDPLDFPLLHTLLIRRLLLQNQRQAAIDYASTYVKNICANKSTLTLQLIGQIRRIIHLLIHRKYGCPSYSVGLHTMLSFLRFHPDMTPESHTLFILLQLLRSARRRGERSFEALNWFRQRWTGIEDEPVRRTIAKLGLQDKSESGRMIALDMASREARFGTRWRRGHQISLHDLSNPRLRSKPFAEVYTRSWRDKEKWIRMGLAKRIPGFVLREGMRGEGRNRNSIS